MNIYIYIHIEICYVYIMQIYGDTGSNPYSFGGILERNHDKTHSQCSGFKAYHLLCGQKTQCVAA